MVFPILGGNSAVGGYSIDNSLRFNDGDSPDLSRTNVASPTNSKKYTYSVWIKRGIFSDGNNRQILSAINGNNRTQILFRSGSNEAIRVLSTDDAFSTFKYLITTDALYRDASAWYHVVCVFDSTDATANDRFKIYVNGVEQSLSISTSVASNYDDPINSGSVAQDLGSSNGSEFFDGYFAEAHFIDGQALSPTDFGEFDSDSGIWKPKAYTGSYGTNGFYLDFENSGSLGADQSGNGNNWSLANLASTDQMIDTPTNNFATLNANDVSGGALSQGNLLQTSIGASNTNGTIGMPTGKWYWEIYINNGGGGVLGIGTGSAEVGTALADLSNIYGYSPNGNKYQNTTASSYGASYGTGDIIGVKFDADTRQLEFLKNNSSQGVAYTVSSGDTYLPQLHSNGTNFTTNFGQDSSFAGATTKQNNTDANDLGDFYYSVPSGYLALCTQNLATELSPTIDDGSQYFNTVLYTGNGGSNSITGVGYQPDWVWVKRRDSAGSHGLHDSNRGSTKRLKSDTTDAEDTNSNILASFDSDGFTIGDGSGNYNASGGTYTSWNWKANAGSTSSNTDGSITSTVQANTTSGFSILTWTGNGTASQSIGHGLGVTPKIMINKNRSQNTGWQIFGSTLFDRLQFNTGAEDANLPCTFSSSTITLPNLSNNTEFNSSGDNFVSYVFAEIEGYSKFGSYTGNGSTDGTFVYTGFRPAWVMVKRTDSTGNWVIYDSKRNGFNVDNDALLADTSNAEFDVEQIDLLSNGLKFRSTANSSNSSGGTYIYACFSANPFVSSTSIPVTAR